MSGTIGIAEKATRSPGFDTVTRVSSTVASRMVASGYRFCARYLSRTEGGTSHYTLTSAEVADLFAANLAIVPVQFGLSTLMPSASAGEAAGEAAVANAVALQIPAGVTLWCDLEWSASVKPDPGATVDYANAWYHAVVGGGYPAGLYVGPNVPLDGEQLGQELAFHAYWKSASAVPWVQPRGFQMVQGLEITVNGITVDPDLAMIDNLGSIFTWWAEPTSEVE